MKLVVSSYVYEPPGIAIIPETEYEAAILSRYWTAERVAIDQGAATSEWNSANGRSYTIRFREPATTFIKAAEKSDVFSTTFISATEKSDVQR